jgi:hypothetical protein
LLRQQFHACIVAASERSLNTALQGIAEVVVAGRCGFQSTLCRLSGISTLSSECPNHCESYSPTCDLGLDGCPPPSPRLSSFRTTLICEPSPAGRVCACAPSDHAHVLGTNFFDWYVVARGQICRKLFSRTQAAKCSYRVIPCPRCRCVHCRNS